MEIFNSKSNEPKKTVDQYIEPVRGSISILIIKVLLILFIFDSLYTIFFYVFSLQLNLPIDLRHHIALALVIIHIGKIILQIFLLLQVILTWTNSIYFFTNDHIIKRSGIFNVAEEIFHYQNIRSISIKQSLVGKIFNYGDILLKTSASGGYKNNIILFGIDNPKKYEEILNKFF